MAETIVNIATTATPVTVTVNSPPATPVTVNSPPAPAAVAVAVSLPDSAPTAVNVTPPAAHAEVIIQEARDAYQLAIAEGFTGTRAEWLASLAGQPGPPGSDGQPGLDGVGKTWVAITQAAYDALTSGERNDSAKIYDITDFTWT